MAKGGKQPGAGRPAGVPNRATTQAREAIAAFVEGNVERLNGWLDAMANENPKDAFNAFMSVVEYHIPKLQRAEISGPDGGPLNHSVKVMFVDAGQVEHEPVKQLADQSRGDK